MTGLLETIKDNAGEAAHTVDDVAHGTVRAVAAAGEGAEHAAATAFRPPPVNLARPPVRPYEPSRA